MPGDAFTVAYSLAEPQPSPPERGFFLRVLRREDAPPAEPKILAAMHAVIRLQRAGGSWELTRELASALRYDLRDLEPALRDAFGETDEVRAAWATSLALAWLERHAGEVEDQWRFLARKAHQRLQQVTASPPSGRTWESLASDFVRSAPPPC